jgi:hypothetical protein
MNSEVRFILNVVMTSSEIPVSLLLRTATLVRLTIWVELADWLWTAFVAVIVSLLLFTKRIRKVGLLPEPVFRPVIVSVEPVGRVSRNLAWPLFHWIPPYPLLLFNKKVGPRTGHDDPEGECRYSSTLSVTLVLDWAGRSTPHSRRRERDPVSIVRRLGEPRGPVWTVRKISPLLDFFFFGTVSDNCMADELIIGVGTIIVPSTSGPVVMCGYSIWKS